MNDLLVPAQIRAARALLGLSQEQLANSADIAVSSVRDIESNRRAPEAQTIASIRRTLENKGVVFIPGTETEGFGVRLVGDRPSLLRRPSVVTMWDGIPFEIEWRGKRISVYISQQAVDDLGGLTERVKDEIYLGIVENHLGEILDGVRRALLAGELPDRRGHLRLTSKYLPSLAGQ